jgi:hypothetical protein
MPAKGHAVAFKGKTQSVYAWAPDRHPEKTLSCRLLKFGRPAERALTTPPDRRFAKGAANLPTCPAPARP